MKVIQKINFSTKTHITYEDGEKQPKRNSIWRKWKIISVKPISTKRVIVNTTCLLNSLREMRQSRYHSPQRDGPGNHYDRPVGKIDKMDCTQKMEIAEAVTVTTDSSVGAIYEEENATEPSSHHHMRVCYLGWGQLECELGVGKFQVRS